MGAAVIPCMDASPVLEFSEHVLNLVALTIEPCIMRDGYLAVDFRGNAGSDAALSQSGSKPVSVVAPVRQQRLGLRKGLDHQRCALIVTHLSFAEQHDQRSPLAIANSMQL